MKNQIDFKKLTPTQFEELCFDLLRCLGFEKMIWRQGGADSGRDIEATWITINPLIGYQENKWFIECKKHENGINPDDISSKFTWAESEDVDVLVVITSSYLTNNCRTWIERRSKNVRFKVKTIENKELCELLENNSYLITKYFRSPLTNLALSIESSWNLFRAIPHPSSLYTILMDENHEFESHQLSFLWNITKLFQDSVDEWSEDNSPLTVDWMFKRLIKIRNVNKSPLVVIKFEELMSSKGVSSSELIYKNYYAAELHVKTNIYEGLAIYSIVYGPENDAIEVLYFSNASRTHYINYYNNNGKNVMNRNKKIIEEARIG